ncbi:DnaJ domain-containing protein [Thermodesulfobacteriota bacterium]
MMRFWFYLLAILYLLSPYDIIPDFLIGGGWVDDLAIIGLLWWVYSIYRGKKAGRPSTTERGNAFSEEDQARFKGESYHRQGSVHGEGSSHPDPYKILEIKEDAPLDEIRAAYLRLANKYHPDKVMHLGEEFKVLAERRFKRIQEAYDRLTHVK